MASLEKAVTQNDGGWDFVCPVNDPNDPCGPYASLGWPTKKIALDRGRGHIDEHLEGTAAKAEGRDVDPTKLSLSLEAFRAKHDVIQTPDGRAVLSAKDIT